MTTERNQRKVYQGRVVSDKNGQNHHGFSRNS